MFKKILNFFVVLFILTGCTQLAFNERFNQAQWNKVLIAPFEGELALIAEEEFEYALAISPKLIVIPASIVKYQLKEHELEDLFKSSPMEAMLKLSLKEKANGIIFAEVNGYSPRSLRAAEIATSSASIYAKLVDANSGTIVASSKYDTSSIFSGENKLIREVSINATEEFKLFFDKIKR